MSINNIKCAYVTLVMKDPLYSLGALALAQSLRNSKTKYDIVCMITNDISFHICDLLQTIFNLVIVVPYLIVPTKPLKTDKQEYLYNSWKNLAITKWNALKLIQYDKICFIDADVIVLHNIDHIFKIMCPSATFSLPWAYPYVKPGLSNPYLSCKHGEIVPRSSINIGLFKDSFVAIGNFMILNPSLQIYHKLQELIEDSIIFGFNSYSMFDEQCIVYLYYSLKQEWYFIDPIYNFIPWHRNWISENEIPYIFHYFGLKPWIQSSNVSPEINLWWFFLHLYASSNIISISDYFKSSISSPIPFCHCLYCNSSSHILFDSKGELICPLYISRLHI